MRLLPSDTMTDVVFTYISGGKKQTRVLHAHDKMSSREAIGLWKVDNCAWKVYATTSQLDALTDDYTHAQVDGGLPVGTPAPSFQVGTVKQGEKTETHGFVLIAQWMSGTNFQKTAAKFRSALAKEDVPKKKDSQDYDRFDPSSMMQGVARTAELMPLHRIVKGCAGANEVGLRDCQGYIKTGISEPIRFVDVHTSWNPQTRKYGHSGQAQQLVDTIAAWGK